MRRKSCWLPPSGVMGVNPQDMGATVEYRHGSFLSIGPMAIGKLKYKTQPGLFKEIQKASKSAPIDFPGAYEFAQALLKESSAT